MLIDSSLSAKNQFESEQTDTKLTIQKDKVGQIIDAMIKTFPICYMVDSFNPSLLPMKAVKAGLFYSATKIHAFYCLETAIKLGDVKAVKNLFSRYESTMPNSTELMRQSFYMEVPFRPIFWLAGVCDPNAVIKMIPSLEHAELVKKHYKIIRFMEKKLGIAADHQHKVPTRTFSRSEYIMTFCKDTAKRDMLLQMLSSA